MSVWWDTSLLPDDPNFPETIRQQIDATCAAIVIWTPNSVRSRWVYAEAKMADEQDKLIQLRASNLDPHLVPLPFNTGNIALVEDRHQLYLALGRRFEVVYDRVSQELIDLADAYPYIRSKSPTLWTEEGILNLTDPA
jgi:hypothetical protein